ncbi:MAG: hypothetical protein NW206_05745 [Hyphomonadaceae bacterium]|nr:hypothetical protein [Hyphomonadaceae bacterium]
MKKPLERTAQQTTFGSGIDAKGSGWPALVLKMAGALCMLRRDFLSFGKGKRGEFERHWKGLAPNRF